MNKKLVIMAISPFFWTMGEDKGIPSVYYTVKGLVEAGHKVHLLLPTDNYKLTKISYKGIYIHRFIWPLRNYPSWRIIGVAFQKLSWFFFLFNAFIKAHRVAKQVKPDIAYGFTLCGAPVAYIIGKIYDIPNITRLFGTFLYPYLFKPVNLFSCFDEVLSFKLPCSALIITDDGTQGDKVAERFKVPPDKIRFWMNGVETDMFNLHPDDEEIPKLRESLEIEANKKVILTASRLVRWKRVDRLINCVPAIISKNKDIAFVIVGDGPERENLQSLSRELGVLQYIRFTGSVSRDRIPYFMSMADIFVSLYDLSNLGNPLLEAITCGKCIVTLNNGGTGKVIENNYNGILLNENNLKELPKVINDLLEYSDLRIKLGNNAKRYALEHFQTWGERMERENNLIEDLYRKTTYSKNVTQKGRGR